MCGEQGFKAVHKTVHYVKFIGKGCSIFFRVLLLRYSVWYLPGRASTEQTYRISSLR